jgi:hypothetical protein
MEVEGVVLARLVYKVPHLKLTHAHRLVALPVAAVHERFHAHGAGRRDPVCDERVDLPQRLRNVGPRRSSLPHA